MTRGHECSDRGHHAGLSQQPRSGRACREQGPGREAGRTWGRETWSRRHRQDFGFDPEVSEQLRRRQT